MKKLLATLLLLTLPVNVGAKKPDPISVAFAAQKGYLIAPATVTFIVRIPHNDQNIGYCVVIESDIGLSGESCKELDATSKEVFETPPLKNLPAGGYAVQGILFQEDEKDSGKVNQIPSLPVLEFEVTGVGPGDKV